MGWIRKPRRPARAGRRPRLEALEARQMLAADGAGLAAAVIDTGVNYRHEALGGGFGRGFKVEGGVDLADGHDTPAATTWQHGTAVAGLIASSDPAHPGVAPGADIVALRVFGDDNKGSYERIADALQWVVDHHDDYHISVANISISDGGNYAQDWFAHDGGVGERIDALIGKLAALDIPVVAAAGNSYAGFQGMGFPAINPATISVAAADASGHLAADAQRLGADLGGASATDLAARGAGLDAPVEGNKFAKVDGSSFAAAEVTGSVLVLQQLYRSRFGRLPSVADLEGWLKAGADPIPGAGPGVSLGLLDLAKSIARVPNPAPPPTVAAAELVATGAGPAAPGGTIDLFVDGLAKGAISNLKFDAAWGNFLADHAGSVLFNKVQVWTGSSLGATAPAGQLASHGHPRGPARAHHAAGRGHR